MLLFNFLLFLKRNTQMNSGNKCELIVFIFTKSNGFTFFSPNFKSSDFGVNLWVSLNCDWDLTLATKGIHSRSAFNMRQKNAFVNIQLNYLIYLAKCFKCFSKNRNNTFGYLTDCFLWTNKVLYSTSVVLLKYSLWLICDNLTLQHGIQVAVYNKHVVFDYHKAKHWNWRTYSDSIIFQVNISRFVFE